MTKYEFLEELRTALEGEVAPAVISENINYYSNYIDSEVAKGKTEAEVIESIGRGTMVAKSIIEASKSSTRRISENFEEYDENGRPDLEKQKKGAEHVLRKILIGIVIVAIVILLLIFLWKIVLPVALVLLVLYGVYRLVKLIVRAINGSGQN